MVTLEEEVNDMRRNYEIVLWLSDAHIPFQDKKTLSSIRKLAGDIKPEGIVIGGDWIDFYAVSKYDKNPDRASKLQEELDEGIRELEALLHVSPSSKVVYLEGNHENRMQRYIWKNPELYGLRALEVPSLLNLKSLGIEYHNTPFIYRDFVFKHGDYCNKYSAAKELDVEGVSGMSGHTHRNQMMSKSDRRGDMAWYSIGHLSDASLMEYINGAANWQQGIAIVHFKKENSTRFHVTQIPIVEHKFLYNDKVYQP